MATTEKIYWMLEEFLNGWKGYAPIWWWYSIWVIQGNKYIGDYKKDLRDGYGVFFFADGSKYSGHWKKGKQHGEGVFQNKEGVMKKGVWVVGRFN